MSDKDVVPLAFVGQAELREHTLVTKEVASRRRQACWLASRPDRRARWLLVLTALVLGGCGGSAEKRFEPSRWLSVEAVRKSAILTLRASGGTTGLGNFNGASRGQVLVAIPRGWRITVRCLNTSSTGNHSCAITPNSLSTAAAFPGASTPQPTVGIAPGRSATFSFIANRSGVFRIASLVGNEEIGNGMWDTLQVGGTRQPTARLWRRVP